MSLTTVYAPFVGKSKQDDGTLLVRGKMTGSDLDMDQQRCDPEWLKTAVPEWFVTGNVREMHQPNAVGKGIGLEQEGDDWILTARIVDPLAVKKVEADVLTGFSIGVKRPVITNKGPDAPNGWISGGRIVETSVVDQPCLESAKFVLAKAAGTTEDAELVETGEWEDVVPAASAAELATKAADVLAQVAEIAPDLTKADNEASDIEGADQAIAIIARLITSEAEGLAAGQLSEAYDIDCLLDAVRALRWFRECEQAEQLQGDDMDFALLGVSADIVKAAQAADATDEAKAALAAEVRKALGVDTEELLTKVADSVTEKITTTIDEKLKGVATEAAVADLKGELEAVKTMAAPGGPQRTRSHADAAKAAEADALRAKAEHFRQLAATVDDRALATGYKQKAAEADAAAAKLAA